MKPSNRRQVLLDTAYQLFNKYGFHPTGIDLIIKESGTSKATLYKHFKSKEVLVLEVLKAHHNSVIANIKSEISNNKKIEYPILTIFDIYNDWFNQASYNGCFFHKARSEYSDTNSAINKYCVESKKELSELIINSLQQNNHDLASAKIKSRGITILLDGSIIDAQISKNNEAANQAKEIAYQMLHS